MRGLFVVRNLRSKGFWILLSRPFHSSTGRHVGYRSEGWWLKDHNPKNYPRNENERRAAALKYGLRDEDYKPAKRDDAIVHGNYPDLGHMTWGHKDPFEDYMDQKHRRNYGEPVPINYLAYLNDRSTDTDVEWFSGAGYGGWPTWAIFFASAVVMFGSMHYLFYVNKVQFTHNVMPTAYPYDYDRCSIYESPEKYPLTAYTFEPAE